MENLPKTLWSSKKTGIILYPAIVLFLCIVSYSGSLIQVSQTRKLKIEKVDNRITALFVKAFDVSRCRLEYKDKTDTIKMTTFVDFTQEDELITVQPAENILQKTDTVSALIVLGPDVSLWQMLAREFGL